MTEDSIDGIINQLRTQYPNIIVVLHPRFYEQYEFEAWDVEIIDTENEIEQWIDGPLSDELSSYQAAYNFLVDFDR